MKSTAVWALGALNVLLLAMLCWRMTPQNSAVAQAAGRPGDYLMIPGEVVGGSNAVVYVLDQSSHQLGAAMYDDSMRSLTTMQPVSLDTVFGSASGGAPVNGRRPAR
jgi:hypothetical protein